MDLMAATDGRVQPSGGGVGGGGGGGMEPGIGKRLLDVLRAVYHMVRRGLCRKRLMMDLHLLLGRGKLAGRAFRDLMAHQPHRSHLGAGAAAAAAGAASPSELSSFYRHNPRDVEFSCNSTPVYVPGVFPFRIRGRRGGRHAGELDAATVAAAFEMMNAQAAAGTGGETPPGLPGATPSPMVALSLGRCPAGTRQLRVTDSPFPVEPEGVDERVDAEADSFIKRFYDQLRLQQANQTPDNCVRRRG